MSDSIIRPTRPNATRPVLGTVGAHLRGERVAPLYLAGGSSRRVVAALAAAAAEVRAAGLDERLLACTGADFAALWRDTLRRGMTPFVRRALASKRAVLLDSLDALREEPFAQWELARLIAPDRLIIVAGRGHLPQVAAWSPVLAARLAGASCLCLHEGTCATGTDARALIDDVAGYYGVPRTTLLSRRRTARIALARQVAMYLLREEGLTYSAVGRLLRRDHATVMYGYTRIRQLSRRRRDIQHDLAALRRACVA